MRDLSLDLETLSVGSRAAIVSIGAVFFDSVRGELGDSFHGIIRLSDYDASPSFEFDSSTIRWWIQQSTEARAIFRKEGIPLVRALYNFANFCGKKDSRVWAKGPAFDCAILKHAYAVIGIPLPWSRRNERCVRTIIDAAKSLTGLAVDVPQVGVSHNARDDAEFQARQVIAAYDLLRRLGGRNLE